MININLKKNKFTKIKKNTKIITNKVLKEKEVLTEIQKAKVLMKKMIEL